MSVSETAPGRLPQPVLDADALRLGQKLREVGRELDQRYLDKSELVRLLLVTLVAGEHMLIVGPPGTAKSALIRHLSRLIDARYFEYLLTRFSEPNEIFGPSTSRRFAKAPTSVASRPCCRKRTLFFLDEIFKSELGDLERAAEHLERTPVFHRQRQPEGAAVARCLAPPMKFPMTTRWGGVHRFLVRALSDNLDKLSLSRSGRAWHPRRDRRDDRRRRGPPAGGGAGRTFASCRRAWASICSFPKNGWRGTKASSFRFVLKASPSAIVGWSSC